MGRKNRKSLECVHERTERTVHAGIVRVVCLDWDAVAIDHDDEAVTDVRPKRRQSDE